MSIAYKGRVFSVELDTIRLPDGTEHGVEIVRHQPSVVLIPLRGADHVLLVRQYRHSIRSHMWELPAGSLNAGEQPEVAAARECEEETGLRPHKVERLRSLYPTPGYCDEEMIFFRVSDLRPPPPDSPHKPDADEHIEVQPFPISEAKAMAFRGDIVDLKTAYALTLI